MTKQIIEFNKEKWNTSPEKTEVLNQFFSTIRPTKTMNRKHSEYGLKHIYERYGNKISDGIDLYVFSDEFIFHAVENGFDYELIRYDKSGMPRAFLNMSEIDIKRIQRYDKA